jgi:hypothetical protein
MNPDLVATTSRSVVPTPKNAPVNVSRQNKMPASRMFITKREAVLEIKSNVAGAYEGGTFDISPVEVRTFPSLSKIATQYTKFKFSKLNFEFVPMAATSVSGTLALAAVPDPNSDFPPEFAALTSISGSQSISVWNVSNAKSVSLQDLIMMNGGSLVKIKTDYTAPNDSFSCAGRLFIGWRGCPANTTLGTLYANYSILLTDPVQNLGAPTHIMRASDAVGQGAGDIDFSAFTHHMTTNAYPGILDAAGFYRRANTRLTVVIAVSAAGLNPTAVLEDDGTPIAPSNSILGADHCFYLYHVPSGSFSQLLTVNVSCAWTYCAMMVVAH